METSRAFSTLASLVRSVAVVFCDALSPPSCAACDQPIPSQRVFCAPCAETVERCPSDDECVTFAHYGGAVAMALRRFKYEERADLARPLGHLLRRAVVDAGIAADVVVPVPLHPRRLAERGYNQAALLARSVADQIDVPFAPRALERQRQTAQQARLGRAERLVNMAEAFQVRDKPAIEGRTILLVDDVFTTGATLLACRDALLRSGAEDVRSICLARAGRD